MNNQSYMIEILKIMAENFDKKISAVNTKLDIVLAEVIKEINKKNDRVQR